MNSATRHSGGWLPSYLTATALRSLREAADVALEMHASIPQIVSVSLFLPALLWSQGAVRSLSRRKTLILISAVVLGLRLLAIAALPNVQVSDFAAYRELSVSLASGRGCSLSGPAGQDDADRYLDRGLTLPRTTAFRAPGAPLCGAMLGGSENFFKFADAVLGVGTCIPIFLIAEPAGTGPAAFAATL